jgi:transcriptional regulator with XRE-family HTH domain
MMIRNRHAKRFVAGQESDQEFRAHFEDAEARTRLLRDLLEVRHVCGKSQKSIAEAMGTVQSAVSDLEGGGTDPRLSTLQRYARAVGTKINVEVPRWREEAELPAGEYKNLSYFLSHTESQGAMVANTYTPDKEVEIDDRLLKLVAS